MRLRSVAWAGVAAAAVGCAAAWIGADVANAHDMAGHPDDAGPSAPSSLEACRGLEDLDPAYLALTVEELEERVLDASPLPPSLAESHLSGIEGALDAYRPDRRDCMRRAMLIHSLASLEHLTGPGGRLWYDAYRSDELKQQFLTGPLMVDLSAERRRDVAAFVEARVVPALQSDGEPDREHWRRMYYGGLLACHADDELLEKLGGQRSEGGCLDVHSIGEAPPTMRRATGVIDPWQQR